MLDFQSGANRCFGVGHTKRSIALRRTLLASTALISLMPGMAMAQELEIKGPGATQTISDAQSFERLEIEDGGKLTVSTGGSLSLSIFAFIGVEGQGTLDITDGGAVEVLDNVTFVGSTATGSGTVNVSGAGSNLDTSTLTVGFNGDGVLNVSDQGLVDARAITLGGNGPGNGTVLVTGTGSKVLSELDLILGERGDGELIVADGGVVEIGGVFKLAEFATGAGTLVIGNTTPGAAGHIQGAGGAAAEIQFGEGNGVIEFNHTEADYVFNANVSGAGDFIHNSGTTTLSGSNDIDGDVIVAGGTLDVTGNTAAGGATIGTNATSNGTLRVVDGGALEIGGTATIGRDDASFGKVTVAGAGSHLDANILRVGDEGIGQLLVDEGGLVVGNFVDIGRGGDGHGRIILEGVETILRAKDISVGTSGGGVLEVREGGTVEVQNTLRLAQDAGSSGELIIGAEEGEAAAAAGDLVDTDGGRVGIQLGAGDATIYFNHTDADYVFNADVAGNGEVQHIAGTTTFAGVIDIGTGGLYVDGGELIISNSTRSQTATLDGADATLTVTGPSGRLNVGQSMSAGLGTAGTLHVNNGGQVDIENMLTIGVTDGAAGDVQVSGTGSQLTTGDAIRVGVGGAGVLKVLDGGLVSTDQFVVAANAGSEGNVLVSGANAKVIAQDLDVGSHGQGQLQVLNGGRVEVANDLTVGSDAVGDGAMVISGSGAVVSVQDEVAIGAAGNGSVTVQNGGVLLSTGAMAVGANGVLSIGGADGGSAAAVGALTDASNGGATISFDDGKLVFNHTSSRHAFNADILGSGTIANQAGFTSLTGDLAAFNGVANAIGGTLSIDTGLSGSAVAKNGGTLTGTGTVGSTLLFESGSTYQADIGTTDFLNGNNLVDIESGVTLSLVASGALALPINSATTILSGGTLTGTFDTVEESLLYLDASLSYDANAVALTLERNGTSFADVAQGSSQKSVAAALDDLDVNSPLYNALVTLSSAEEARQAFAQLSAEVHGSTTGSLLQGAGAIRSVVGTRVHSGSSGGSSGGVEDMFLAYFPATPPAHSNDGLPDWDSVIDVPATPKIMAWGQAYGAFGAVAGTPSHAGMTSREGGLVLGVEVPDFHGFTAGVLTGIGQSAAQVSDLSSTSTVNNFTLGAYAGRELGTLNAQFGATATLHAIASTRNVSIGGFSDTLTAQYGAATLQGFGELGYVFDAPVGQIEPFAGLAVIHQMSEGFTEAGGAAALQVDAGSNTLGIATLGVRGSAELAQLTGGQTVSASAGVAWRHTFGNVAPGGTAKFASGGDSFTMGGAPADRDTLSLEAGIQIDLSHQASLSAGYLGEFGKTASSNALNTRLGIKF